MTSKHWIESVTKVMVLKEIGVYGLPIMSVGTYLNHVDPHKSIVLVRFNLDDDALFMSEEELIEVRE